MPLSIPPQSSCLGATLAMAKIVLWAPLGRHVNHYRKLPCSLRSKVISTIAETSPTSFAKNIFDIGQDRCAILLGKDLDHRQNLPYNLARKKSCPSLKPPWQACLGATLALVELALQAHGKRTSAIIKTSPTVQAGKDFDHHQDFLNITKTSHKPCWK